MSISAPLTPENVHDIALEAYKDPSLNIKPVASEFLGFDPQHYGEFGDDLELGCCGIGACYMKFEAGKTRADKANDLWAAPMSQSCKSLGISVDDSTSFQIGFDALNHVFGTHAVTGGDWAHGRIAEMIHQSVNFRGENRIEWAIAGLRTWIDATSVKLIDAEKIKKLLVELNEAEKEDISG